jgi:hypothetical protein
MSTPALWSIIGTSDHDGIPLKQKHHIFDLWLNRSRFCPLSIQIVGKDVAEILATVVPHRARWEDLGLCLFPFDLPIIEGPMPLLRYLDLNILEYPATDVLAFREAPMLRTVLLNDFATSRIILPWAQLTSLTLLSVYLHKIFPVLQKTSNLVHCELWVCFDSDNDQLGPVVPLPCLQSLALADAGDGPVTDFLETFIVPALRSLKIPEDFIEPDPIQSLTGFISKSGCKLEEVHITGERLLPQDSYRHAFPSIRQFSFDNEDDSSDCDASDVEDKSDSE